MQINRHEQVDLGTAINGARHQKSCRYLSGEADKVMRSDGESKEELRRMRQEVSRVITPREAMRPYRRLTRLHMGQGQILKITPARE